MEAGQVLSALAFEEQVTSVTNNRQTQLDYRFRAGETPGATVVEVWANFAAGDRNAHTITINDPIGASMPDGGYYRAVINGTTYTYEFTAGETAAEVAAAFARIIDTDSSLQAWQDEAAPTTIKVLGNMAGVALVVAVDAADDADDSAVAGAISSAEDTVASGTGVLRKVSEITIATGIRYENETLKSNPTLRYNITGVHYNGSPTTPVAATGGAFGPFTTTHPNTIAVMEAQA